jgi:GNAT superfamily N-acetyltransferase
VIRAATEADAPVIADIQARTWRWAYSDFIAPDDMPDPAERAPAWREHIAAGGVRVFDQDGTVVGYSAVQGDELKSLYVDPAAQGAGVGGRLLADATQRIRAAGHARAWLYVYAHNAQGCAFYEHHGWVAVGGLVGEAHWRAPGRRYERKLSPTAPAHGTGPPGGETPRA